MPVLLEKHNFCVFPDLLSHIDSCSLLQYNQLYCKGASYEYATLISSYMLYYISNIYEVKIKILSKWQTQLCFFMCVDL